jgi:hypothetical protein
VTAPKRSIRLVSPWERLISRDAERNIRKLGYDAGAAGEPLMACPYHRDSLAAYLWCRAWHDGMNTWHPAWMEYRCEQHP